MVSQCPRILSISSDAIVFQTRNRILEFAGFEVVGCFQGLGALSRFNDEPVDPVIIGHSVDAEIRLQLLRAMKQARPRVPVVMIYETGDFGEDAAEADASLESLDSPEHLIRTVSSLLGFSPQPTARAKFRAATAG